MPRVTASIDAFLKSATAQAAMEAGITDNPAFRTAVGADPGLSYGVIAGAGIDYTGAADSTAAVEAAITALVADGIYHGRLLAGTLKLNITVPEYFVLQGASPCYPASWAATETAATELVPNNDALPVVLFDSLRGQELRWMAILGNGAGTSAAGVKISKDSGAEFPGNGLRLDKVCIAKFTKGLWNQGGTQIQIDQCIITACGAANAEDGAGIFLEGGGTGGPDTLTARNTSLGGDVVASGYTAIYADGTKGLNLINCELGNCEHLAWLVGGTTATFLECNYESFGGDFIVYRFNGCLTWIGGQVMPGAGNADAVLVRSETDNGHVTLVNVRTINFNSGVAAVEAIHSSGDLPDVIGMPGAIVKVYSDNTFTTLRYQYDRRNPAVCWWRATDFALAAGDTFYTIPWATQISGSTSGITNTAGVFTVPKPGRYKVTAMVRWSAVPTYAYIRITSAGGTNMVAKSNTINSTDDSCFVTGIAVIDSPHSDDVRVECAAGAATSILGSDLGSCVMSIERLPDDDL